MDSFDNWDLMPNPGSNWDIGGNITDPWATEPGYGNEVQYPIDPGYSSPGDSEQQTANDQVGAGGGYDMGGIQSGTGGGSSSLGSLASWLARALGLTGGAGGAGAGTIGSLLPLLSALGIGAGGFMGYNATNKATDQMAGAVKDANKQITDILGGAQAGYQPYQQAGQGALGQLANIGYKPLAGNFRPLGSGQGMNGTLGSMMGGR